MRPTARPWGSGKAWRCRIAMRTTSACRFTARCSYRAINPGGRTATCCKCSCRGDGANGSSRRGKKEQAHVFTFATAVGRQSYAVGTAVVGGNQGAGSQFGADLADRSGAGGRSTGQCLVAGKSRQRDRQSADTRVFLEPERLQRSIPEPA